MGFPEQTPHYAHNDLICRRTSAVHYCNVLYVYSQDKPSARNLILIENPRANMIITERCAPNTGVYFVYLRMNCQAVR